MEFGSGGGDMAAAAPAAAEAIANVVNVDGSCEATDVSTQFST